MDDRETLIELINEGKNNRDAECENYFSCAKCPHGENCEAEFIADRLIANGVTVQKHGRWEIKVDDDDCEYAMCSCCEDVFYDPDGEDTIDIYMDFCPNCGAKMDAEEDERCDL